MNSDATCSDSAAVTKTQPTIIIILIKMMCGQDTAFVGTLQATVISGLRDLLRRVSCPREVAGQLVVDLAVASLDGLWSTYEY